MSTPFYPSHDDPATLANWRTAPYSQWAFHHVSDIVPSAVIKHSPKHMKPLPAGPDLKVPSFDFDGETYDLEQFLNATSTDGLVLLHKGRLVYETYRTGMTASDQHILMSISKSMLGLLAAILTKEGRLDVNQDVLEYLPELSNTGFAGATIQQLLDMRCGVVFDEDYLATEGAIIDYRKATNWNPISSSEEPADLRSFFLTLNDPAAAHGGAMDYKSPCSDLLGWVIERICQKRYADVFSERVWSTIGAEYPAMITVDRLGAPRVAGGMSMTTRDLARVGQLLVDDGGGIIPKEWIEDIEQNGDRDAWQQGSFAEFFKDLPMHYRSKWYCFLGDSPVLHCLGIHGQNLFVDRQEQLVMAKFASAREPLDTANDLLSYAFYNKVKAQLATGN